MSNSIRARLRRQPPPSFDVPCGLPAPRPAGCVEQIGDIRDLAPEDHPIPYRIGASLDLEMDQRSAAQIHHAAEVIEAALNGSMDPPPAWVSFKLARALTDLGDVAGFLSASARPLPTNSRKMRT